MQTFLSEYTFAESASVLDTKRLVKQLLEGLQIIDVIAGNRNGWRHHPAVKMWAGHGGHFYYYLSAIRDEMEIRNFKWQNNWQSIQDIYNNAFRSVQSEHIPPAWISDSSALDRVVNTHRRALYLKDPLHYDLYKSHEVAAASDVCCSSCNYYWPVASHGFVVPPDVYPAVSTR